MEQKTTDKIFVNTLMDKDLVEKLDAAAEKNENSRSGMVRLLIRKGLESMNVEPKKQNVSSKK